MSGRGKGGGRREGGREGEMGKRVIKNNLKGVGRALVLVKFPGRLAPWFLLNHPAHNTTHTLT